MEKVLILLIISCLCTLFVFLAPWDWVKILLTVVNTGCVFAALWVTVKEFD